MREQLEPRRRKLSAEAAARDRFGHTYLYAPAGTPLGDQMGRLTERSRGMDGAALSRVQERAEPEAGRSDASRIMGRPRPHSRSYSRRTNEIAMATAPALAALCIRLYRTCCSLPGARAWAVC